MGQVDDSRSCSLKTQYDWLFVSESEFGPLHMIPHGAGIRGCDCGRGAGGGCAGAVPGGLGGGGGPRRPPRPPQRRRRPRAPPRPTRWVPSWNDKELKLAPDLQTEMFPNVDPAWIRGEVDKRRAEELIEHITANFATVPKIKRAPKVWSIEKLVQNEGTANKVVSAKIGSPKELPPGALCSGRGQRLHKQRLLPSHSLFAPRKISARATMIMNAATFQISLDTIRKTHNAFGFNFAPALAALHSGKLPKQPRIGIINLGVNSDANLLTPNECC